MTAAELSQQMRDAVEQQFGFNLSQEMFPAKYFDYSVQVIAPDGTVTPRAPKYCATSLGATQMASIFSADSPQNGGFVCNGIVLGNAINFTGLLDSWNDNKLVPYLSFGAKGPYVNAGLLLDYFNHGWPWARALEYAQSEVKGAL